MGVFGEITTGAKLDYEKIVRTTVKGIGYDSFVDDLASVESKGLSCWSQEVQVRINKQSPDIATRLGKKLTDVRKDGSLWWLRPDGKTQVTVEYKQNDDGSVEPLKIHTVVISTQHAEPSKA